MDPATLVDYARSLDCIHCGLCLRTCPTYRLTGSESSSPRGRIYLMRAVAEGELEPDADFREEMDFCLVCRHCESVCPAGVQFGAMMEHTRGAVGNGRRGLLARVGYYVGFRWLLPKRLPLKLFTGALGLAQRLGLVRVFAPLFGSRGKSLAGFPQVPAGAERRRLPERTPARAANGTKAGDCAVLEGCVMPELFGRVNRATVDVLAAAGHDVHSPRTQGCCGALHAHNGEMEGARELARGLIAAFEPLGDCPVVVNSAGCGAHMKEYGRLLADDPQWSERAARFAARVRDFSEVVAQEEDLARLALRPPRGVQGPLTYDDPCHLCHGQGVRTQPRTLLEALPDTPLVELEDSESCCGSAGIYSFLRPDDSQAVLDEKLAALERSGARVLVTANPGCHMQWESGLKRAGSGVRVMHVAEVLAAALEDGRPEA